MGDRNPWDFRFVRSLARPDEFRDEGASIATCAAVLLPLLVRRRFTKCQLPPVEAALSPAAAATHTRSLDRPFPPRSHCTGPCVVLASPGMLQSGFSRMLFDRWCEDPRNGVVLAGYSVEGTLARRLESNPSEVESLQNRRLIRRIGVERVSFSGACDTTHALR
jgi:Cft2 family RNA processing exonuclease